MSSRAGMFRLGVMLVAMSIFSTISFWLWLKGNDKSAILPLLTLVALVIAGGMLSLAMGTDTKGRAIAFLRGIAIGLIAYALGLLAQFLPAPPEGRGAGERFAYTLLQTGIPSLACGFILLSICAIQRSTGGPK